jgi:tRNA1Val (adenine37-N6)-methyltransferase
MVNESNLLNVRLRIVQSEKGYRYSIEPFILSDFITLKSGVRIIDLGTGNGIIPLLLSQRERHLKIIGVEIQEHLVFLAKENIRLNRLEEIIEIFQLDIKKVYTTFPPASFDLVVGNPPYWRLRDGRINPDLEKAIARHEIAITLPEYIASAAYLVHEQGKICLIFLPSRLRELLEVMKEYQIAPSRLRFVHSYPNSPAKLVLIEGIKSLPSDTRIERPLVIYKSVGVYTDEMISIYNRYPVY